MINCNFIYSQGWVSIYNPAWEGNINRGIDGGFIILAEVNNLIKFDSNGNFINKHEVNNFTTNNFFYNFSQEFLLLQTDKSEFPTKASATLLDANKETKWVYQLEDFPFHENSQHSSSGAKYAVQNEEGDYFILGDSFEFASLSPVEAYDYYIPFLIKLNAQGEREWFQTYCNTLPPLDYGPQRSYAIEKSGDGGFVFMTIVDDSPFQNQYPGFTKVDSLGKMLWKQYFYNKLIIPQHNGIEYITQSPTKNMVVTEQGEIVTTGMSIPRDVYIGTPYLMTLHSDGSLKSFIPIDIPFNQDFFLNIKIEDIQKYGENFVLLYAGKVGEKSSMGFVIVDKSGNILLNKFYDNTTISTDYVTQIMVLEEGGFAISGSTFVENIASIFLIKTDSLGNCYPDIQFTTEDTGLGFYQFDNQSQYADSYLWEFGDGTTDTTAMASHQYQATGTYEVCLTATNLCDSFTKCENIEVSEVTDIEVYEWEEGLLVYPNPVHNTDLFVDIPQSTEDPRLTLYNNSGKQLMNQYSNSLEVSELEAGIYYLQIQIREETTTRKVLVY